MRVGQVHIQKWRLLNTTPEQPCFAIYRPDLKPFWKHRRCLFSLKLNSLFNQERLLNSSAKNPTMRYCNTSGTWNNPECWRFIHFIHYPDTHAHLLSFPSMKPILRSLSEGLLNHNSWWIFQKMLKFRFVRSLWRGHKSHWYFKSWKKALAVLPPFPLYVPHTSM